MWGGRPSLPAQRGLDFSATRCRVSADARRCSAPPSAPRRAVAAPLLGGVRAAPRACGGFGAVCRALPWPWRPLRLAALGRAAPLVAATARGEPSWHRRARRQRQAARALIALDAARRRLAAHHGGGGRAQAAWAAMPPRRAGSAQGGGGDAEFSLRQGLRDLLARVERQTGGDRAGERGRNAARRDGAQAQARGRRDASPSRGTRDARAGAGPAGERRPQEGDWTCKGCGFQPNFARRRTCFECRRPRSPRGSAAGGAGGGTRGLSQGPVGAGGLRPLLGRGAAAAGVGGLGKGELRAPSYRVPGASVAARAQATATASPGAAATTGGGAAPGNGTAPAPPRSTGDNNGTLEGNIAVGGAEVDEEGFRVVRGSAWRRQRAAAADSAGAGGAARDRADAAARTSEAGNGGAAEARAAADEGDPEDATVAPTADELHRAWLAEVAVVRRLRQQGLPTDHPAMVAACATRDEAEGLWRSAKDPAPTAVRLSRAQAKLDRAISAQAETRTAMLELEEAHRAKMAELQSRLDSDDQRVRQRRQQLREIQTEIAGDGGHREAEARQGAAVQQVHTALCKTVAPTIAALVEQLDSSTPAWGVLNGLLGTLSDSKHLLEKAIAPRPPATATFDIGDGEGGQGGQAHDADSDSEWSESHELRGGPERHGQEGSEGGAQGSSWLGHGLGRDDRDDGFQPMDTDDWWHGSQDTWSAGVRWEACGHGKWARARQSWADAWETEAAQDDEADAPPAAARRRLEPAPQPVATGAAAAGGDKKGEEADVEERRKAHHDRVQRIVSAAIDAGVQPLTAQGEELVVLDPNQLAAWAEENLSSSGPNW